MYHLRNYPLRQSKVATHRNCPLPARPTFHKDTTNSVGLTKQSDRLVASVQGLCKILMMRHVSTRCRLRSRRSSYIRCHFSSDIFPTISKQNARLYPASYTLRAICNLPIPHQQCSPPTKAPSSTRRSPSKSPSAPSHSTSPCAKLPFRPCFESTGRS